MNAVMPNAGGERLILWRPDGLVEIEEGRASMREVTARPRGAPSSRVVTSYPPNLIEVIVEVMGVAWVCEEISRDEDLGKVQRFFEDDFLPYVSPSEFAGKRILDFRCGSGSSTMVLARMFPDSRIVGLDLSPESLTIARARSTFYGYPNVAFERLPSSTRLPEKLGQFDFIVMSAVFEHLLPSERCMVMPQLWDHLAIGGCLLLNQTPHRFFPFESHTTGLPLINYLPDRLAYFVSRHFSSRSLENESWESLLRKGIRGATEREILASVGKQAGSARPVIRAPRRPGYRDRVDVWYAARGPRHRAIKAGCRELLRVVERALGTTWVTNLALAISKESVDRPEPRA